MSEIFDKQGDIASVFQEWKNAVDIIWENNTTIIKQKNPRRNIRRLMKIKKPLKKDLPKLSKTKRKEVVGRIKVVDEEIEAERQSQFKNKISKVVEKLRSSKGINGPGMWEVMKQLNKKKATPPSAIKSKDGQILEDADLINER